MLTIDSIWQGDSLAKIKGLRKFMKEELQRQIVEWHGKYLPKHFTRAAFTRYKQEYKPRGAMYERYKERQFGHRNPLVYRGSTKDAVTASIRVSGTSSRAKGTMSGGQALNFGGRGRHNLRAEMLAINPKEERAMNERFEKRVVAFLNKPGKPKRKRHR